MPLLTYAQNMLSGHFFGDGIQGILNTTSKKPPREPEQQLHRDVQQQRQDAAADDGQRAGRRVLLQNLHFIKDIGLKGYAVERHFWHFLKNSRFC